MIRDYETIFILNPNLDEEDAGKVITRMSEVVETTSGEMLGVERWGKRRLAYEVKKHKKGEYVLFRYKGEAVTVTELERNFKMTDPVIKYMTVRCEKEMLEHESVRKAEEESKAVAAAKEEEAKAEEAAAALAKAAAEPATGPANEEVTEPVTGEATGEAAGEVRAEEPASETETEEAKPESE